MKDNSKTKSQLVAELNELRKRVSELEKTEHLYNLTDRSLRDSETRNRNIVESSLAGMHMYELKEDGRLIFSGANPAADRILGIDNSIFIGKTIEEAFPLLVETNIPEKYKQVAASGKTWHSEQISFEEENIRGAFEISAFQTAQNKMVAMFNNITERKQAELALQMSEQRYRSLFEHSSDAIIIHDFDGNIIDVNERVLILFGYEKPEILQKPIIQLHPESALEKSRNAFETITNEGSTNFEIEFIKKNKDIFPAEVSSTIMDLGEKKVILGIIRDITERKQAEYILRSSEAKYRHLIEDSGDAIYLLYDRKFEVINSKFTELFGVTLERANSPDFDFMNLVAPESRPLIEERMRLQAEGHKLEPKYEFRSLNQKGQTILVEASVTYVKYKQGTAVQGIIRDISEKRKLQEQLQQAQKMEAIGTLAGGIAHDFNNLLTVINGYSEMALLKIDKSNKLHRIIESISQAGERAVNLTSQLLAFSRKQIYNAEIVEINSVIHDMDQMLRRLIGEDIDIEMILAKNIFNIKADKSQLEQIFVNLIVNARDAVLAVSFPDFKKKITIETGNTFLDQEYVSKHPGSQIGPHVFISVSDNGIGVDEETQAKIFEPFFTTKEKNKGTGLGMATVYGIVKQNNGSIYIYSEPGKGTTFKIYWPVSEQEAIFRIHEELDNEDYSGNESILLVEDDVDVCKFAKEALTSLGYKVVDALNGKAALDIVEKDKNKFKLIVTDLIMPELNGKELVEKVKKLKKDIKVIYVSGYTDNHIVHDGMLDKGVNFIQKPYSARVLAEKVRHVLNGQ